MHQSGKNVLLALFALSTLFAFLQPYAFASSDAKAVEDKKVSADKQDKTVASVCSASSTPLTIFLDTYLPNAKIASFDANTDLLNNMQSVEHLLERKHETFYASEKEEYVSDEVVVTAQNFEPKTQSEVKGEAILAESYSLDAEVLFNIVNDYRASLGLAPLQKDESLMQVARERAPELFDEIFVHGNMHAGFYARNLPYLATENIIYNHTESGALNWWLGSPIHRAVIANPAHTHTGIACSGKTCSQIYTHFQARTPIYTME